MTEKTNYSEDKQVTDKEKKALSKFNSSTDRNKTNTSVSQTSSIFGPHRTRRQKRYILNLRKHFLSHAFRGREMNSLEILNTLHYLSVRHAGVYPADRLPLSLTQTDDHDSPSTSMNTEQGRISIATACRP